MPKVLLLAWDRVFKIKDAFRNKQYKPKDIQELLRELIMMCKIFMRSWLNLDEEIISSEFNLIHIEDHDSTTKNNRFDTESYLLESLLNRDTLMASSLKIDSLLAEFASEIIFVKSIPQGIDKANCDPEKDIHLVDRLLYDNSSPRPPEEFASENSNVDIDSFSQSPIPVEDSDSFMEEIDLSFTLDDPMLSGIEEDDDDSERNILIHEELLDNYSLSLPVIESYLFDIPSFSRPLAKPPDGNTGFLNIKMMGDISKQKVPIPGHIITRVSNQEKSPDLLYHQGLKNFQPSAKCPMMIHVKNIPILDVPLFHFYPLDQFKYGGNWVKLSDLKQALHGRHPMLIHQISPSVYFIVSEAWPMLKSSYVGGVVDVRMGTPTQVCVIIGSDGYAYLVLCEYRSIWVRLPKFVCGHALLLVLQLVGPLGVVKEE
nr:hypothetical protein [Tanacetum cinerariifolium]